MKQKIESLIKEIESDLRKIQRALNRGKNFKGADLNGMTIAFNLVKERLQEMIEEDNTKGTPLGIIEDEYNKLSDKEKEEIGNLIRQSFEEALSELTSKRDAVKQD